MLKVETLTKNIWLHSILLYLKLDDYYQALIF